MGEVYELGPHRLVCGDCRERAVWEALLGGEKLQMVWTDPPYGVSIVGGTKDPRRPTHASGNTVENDDLPAHELRAFLTLALGEAHSRCEAGAAWYAAAPAGPLFYEFGAVLGPEGVDIWRHTLIWRKHAFVFGRSDYHYQHEPIFYGWVPGAAHYFTDDRTQSTMLDFDRPPPSNKDHPTVKPIELVERCISNSSKPGWIVGDPFGGSGTTLLASARTGRVARVIELSPHYCDVIRRRYTAWARAAGMDPGPGALDIDVVDNLTSGPSTATSTIGVSTADAGAPDA